MEKAYIEIQNNSKTKITVHFNPESYNLSYGASYSEKKIPGLNGPITQFVSGESTTLDMTLYFDTYVPATINAVESGTSVTKDTSSLSNLLVIDGTLHQPPAVKFCWGKLQFYGYVQSLKETYTMFLSDGTPVRAKVDISFKSLLNPSDNKRVSPFESPDRTKVRILHEKEQLWHYAWTEYGDVERWREIAAANNISNPLMLKPGTAIRLPAL